MINLPAVFQSLKRHPRPLRFFAALCLQRAGVSRLFLVKHRDFVLRFHPTRIAAALFADPDFRRDDFDFLHSYLKRGDIVLDVGANIGTLALTASAMVGEKGRVLAFEPHSTTFALLLENIRLNQRQNLLAHNVALGERTGRLCLSNLPQDDQNAILPGGGGISVPEQRLDSFLKGIPHISLLKVDVEGYEKFVLEGAGDWLAKTACIYFESFEPHFLKYGYRCVDLFGFLGERGFSVYRPDKGILRRIPSDYVSRECENLLAVRRLDDFLGRTSWQMEG